MKRTVKLLVILAALGLAAPATAEQGDFPGIDDPKLAQAIEEAANRPQRRYCAELAPLWAEAVKRSKSPPAELMLMSANTNVLCAIEEERYEDASSLIVRTETKFGQQGFFDRLALALHAHLQELDLAVARVGAIAQKDQGAALAKTEPVMLFQLNSSLVRAKRADLVEAMWSSIMASPIFPELDPDVRGGAAINLLGVKAETASLTPADAALLDLLTNSSAYAGMMADRRYATIWPFMEERAGDGLARLIDADVKLNTERYEASPDDGRRLSNLGYSLLQAGKIRELIELTTRFREKDFDYSQLSEDGTWIVNYMATALRAAGRQQEGIAVLEGLASVDPEAHSWVVNYVINHAIALGEDNQHAAALKALDRAQKVADEHGSAYARALVAGQRACSHYKLGHADQVPEQIAVLEGLRADAPSAVIGYAMCAGREDLAIAWAREALAKESSRKTMIGVLQPAYMRDKPTSVTDQEPYRLLAKSPELASEFEKVARVVPERFAPLGGRLPIVPSVGATAVPQ